MTPRILLLQARTQNDPMLLQELACFVSQSQLPEASFQPWNLCEAPPRLAQLKGVDAIMVGGSGDFYVSKGDLPHFEALLDFLRELVATRLPTFASCFGFQCLVKALGGSIVHAPEQTEVGSYELQLTPAGRSDELLGTLPERFLAQEGHKDQADRLPEGFLNLAGSPLSSLQAFRVPGAPIWATQFHPELTGAENLARYQHYLEGYAGHLSEQEIADTFDRFQESPESSGLLSAFVNLVFGQ